jgi:CRP-like cAMP-binding protein
MLDSLPHAPLFQDITPMETDLLKAYFEPYSCPAGTVIFGQGDPATHLYLITSGKVAIQYKPYDGIPMVLTRLRAGDVFGWSAVIRRAKYTSSVISETNLESLRIHGDQLWDLVDEEPEMGIKTIDRLARMVSPRWENAHTQIKLLLESGHENQTGRSA